MWWMARGFDLLRTEDLTQFIKILKGREALWLHAAPLYRFAWGPWMEKAKTWMVRLARSATAHVSIEHPSDSQVGNTGGRA